MNWSHVFLIWRRETRDQLRDRRMLFTMAVLPLLLYPLLGVSMLQVSQFMQEHPSRVWVIGTESLPRTPLLLEDGKFAAKLGGEKELGLLELTILPRATEAMLAGEQLSRIPQKKIRSGEYDAVVYFPPDFKERMQSFRELSAGDSKAEAAAPQPKIFVNMASDKSRIAFERIERVLYRWRREIVRKNLRVRKVPQAAAEPFKVVNADVSEVGRRRAATWSKTLPFVLLVWALTGAFYPAVDLCAGEKERGTMETLLCSPARRDEIVWGKLLTVASFSAVTSLLNLLSLGVTGTFLMQKLGSGMGEMAPELGPPPWPAMIWLLLVLLPVAGLFSALAVAIAAFARSTKEGQYYMMPLMMVSLPLMVLAMLPSAELSWGLSLIPITGLMLWLRALMEAQYVEAARFAVPVLGVTMLCCLLAIRWAVRQFNEESVLFRESERFEFSSWLQRLMRDREATPAVAQSLLCGLMLWLIPIFAGMMLPKPIGWGGMAKTLVVTQLAFFLAPTLIMTVMLTRSPVQTLSLRLPRFRVLLLGGLLVFCLHPAAMWLGVGVEALYPLSDSLRKDLAPLQEQLQGAPLWSVLLVVALTPAVCEELAFRGFVLSGLRRLRDEKAAIVISSLFFGVTHGLFQQSVTASVLGMVLGYLLIRSGSIWTGVLYHITHNSLSILLSRMSADFVEQNAILSRLFLVQREGELSGVIYHPATAAVGLVLGAMIFRGIAVLGKKPDDQEPLDK